jgi:PIN domain nuclease of toxin-antitoxin system
MLLEDDSNPLLYSAVTIWEIRIKQALGKLERMENFEHFADADMAVTHLPVTHAHAEAAAVLPLHHRDPFDRMLIAQAQIEDAVILTTDPAFAAYDVRTAW